MLELQTAATLFQTGFYRYSYSLGCCCGCTHTRSEAVSDSMAGGLDLTPLAAGAVMWDMGRFVSSAPNV
ncbi:hypothetical protein M3223_17395 [Paenibacillus pasadenensis]|uniref:hypothetical protein n=1 Tax=Paenibacillus pasadenensis TaxID=217090 RepID=UPI0020402027|nr:hypothetical protein [Paenibacillus pasadenensis]MCM3749135.1 hypothetical protein [Paenibacillus pasadenensis]